MKLQVLGPGCAKCKQLHENVEQAVRETGATVEVEKVEDLRAIMKFGVMVTPALAVDGKVKSVGRILSPAEIKKFLPK